MGDSSGDSEENYEVYGTGSDMFCFIALDNNKQGSAKTPGPKPRYKQSYREAWESMRDFKGWLSSVPGNTSKAYCKLCQKELHCHRLSLLKHKVTFKHQKKEEEQKLSKLRGEKIETTNKNVNDNFNENAEESNTNDESVEFNLESENCEEDGKIILSRATTSDTLDSSFQNYEQKNINFKNKFLSTHVLDISRGTPADLIQVVLYKLIDGRWTLVHEGVTNSEGRYNYFVENVNEFSEGRYKLHYDVDKYFERQNQETIFPFIEVVFDVKEVSSKYHIPLLLSPYGYSTYRGS